MFLKWRGCAVCAGVSTVLGLWMFGETSLTTHRLAGHYHRPTVHYQCHTFSICEIVSPFSVPLKRTSAVLQFIWWKLPAACVNKELLVSTERFVQFLWHLWMNCWRMLTIWDRKWGAAHLWLAGFPDPAATVMAVPLGQGHTRTHTHTLEYVTKSRERTEMRKWG